MFATLAARDGHEARGQSQRLAAASGLARAGDDPDRRLRRVVRQLSVAVHDGYGTPGYDMGIFDQGVWLLSRFHAPFVTVMGRNLFGDHTSFILLLAVPLYWVWPHAQTLLVLQTCLLAAAAVPVYLLALRRTTSVLIATALAAAYLLNPAVAEREPRAVPPRGVSGPLGGGGDLCRRRVQTGPAGLGGDRSCWSRRTRPCS